MFTNIILLFTENLDVLDAIAFIMVPLGTQMILLTFSNRPGKVFLFLLFKCIIDAFQLVLIRLYGGSIIAVDMFLNLVTTSAKESGELLSNLLPTIVFILIVYIPTIILAIKSLNAPPINPILRTKLKKGSWCVLLIGLLFIGIAKLTPTGFAAKYSLYPYNVLYNLDFAIKKYEKITNYSTTSKDFTYNAVINDTVAKKDREIVVFVLGETARAANLSHYGYYRETTPYTDTIRNLIYFGDVLTQSNTTHKIVPLVLTPADALDFELIYKSKSIITAYKEVGYKTAFISNQKYNKSFVYHHYNEADYKINLSDKNVFDGELMQYIIDFLNKNTKEDLFIFVHLYGSHFNYYQRYPKEFEVFVPDKYDGIKKKNKTELINSYDNSILHTDRILRDIISITGKQDAQSLVLYASDHGEDLLDDNRNRFLHASPIPTYYQIHIPLFIWLSDKYVNNCNDKYRNIKENSVKSISNNSIFHTLLDISSISTPYLDSTLAVSSNKFNETTRYYLNDHDGCTPVYKIEFKKQDINEFNKRKVKLKVFDY